MRGSRVRVVRLCGSDADLRAVAREAVRTLCETPDGIDAAFFSRLHRLNLRRHAFLAASAAQPTVLPPSDDASTHPPSSRLHRVIWYLALGIGLAAAMVVGATMGEKLRRQYVSYPDLEAAIANVAFPIALVALAIVLLLRVPGRRGVQVGMVLGIVVAVVPLALELGYRLVAGNRDASGFTQAQVSRGIVQMTCLLILVLAVAGRCHLAGRSMPADAPPSRPPRTGRSPDGRALREEAASLARIPVDPGTMKRWCDRLDRMRTRGVPDETLAQARGMTPASWLAWLCYDGEIEVASVLPGR